MDSYPTIIELFMQFHFSNEILIFLVPMILMAIDIFTGFIKAWATKTFSSKKMRLGLSKKVGEIAIIVIGELLSFSLGLPKYLMQGISIYIIFMETISILENAEKMGAPLPKQFSEMLNNVDQTAITDEEIEEAIRIIENLQKREDSSK